MIESGNFIASEPREGTGTPIRIVNPATGERVCEYHEASAQDVETAVDAAEAAFAKGDWSLAAPADRARVLNQCADDLEAASDEFCRLETTQTGKPLEREVRAAEMPLIVDALRFFAGAARSADGLRSGEFVSGKTSMYRRDPIGVVGLVVPWNYPLMMAVWKVGAALAAGCTTVIKPAGQTPGTALSFAELAARRLPPGVINVVSGDATAGQAMSEDPRIRVLSVTGSTRTGRDVMARSAESLKRVALELGGKAPVLVFNDADLEAAASTIAFASIVNSGQDCVAATRIYVQRESYLAFCDSLVDELRAFSMGDPLDESSDIGPLISARQFERVSGYVRDALDQGSTLLHGDAPSPETPKDGFYFSPVVLTDVPDSARLVREEVFGPVVYVAPFDDADHGLRLANDSAYALSAGVWTSDLRCAMRMSRDIRAGTVWVNDHLTFASEFPHSGQNDSGSGLDLSTESIAEFQTRKHIVISI